MYYSYWNKVPFVRFLLPFVLGISTALYLPCPVVFSFAAFLFFLSGFLVLFRFFRRFRFAVWNGIFLFATLYFFGISLNLYQDELFSSDHFIRQHSATCLVLQIDEPPASKVKSFKLHAKVLSYMDSLHGFHSCSGNLLLYAAKDSFSSRLRYGDMLVIRKELIRDVPGPQNPDEFNYKRYLRFHHVHYQAYLRQGDYIRTSQVKQSALFTWVYGVQDHFKHTLVKYIASPSEAGVAQALLYGYDDDIDPDVVQAYSNTGTLHVLAVSGMHVGIIFWILGLLLKPLDRSKRTKLLKHILVIIGLWVYSLLCGLSPSILRATVMFTFIILGQMVGRPTNVYNTLAISAFCLLCTDTNMIANVGFQLSYLAVIGIVFLQPYVYEWYDATTWTGDQVWKITSVSIAAQLATFPLGLLYFHQFPNYFLFSNLIIIPLTTVVLYIGIVLMLFSGVPFIAGWLGKLMYWGIALTNAIVRFVEQLPFSYVNGIHISILQTLFIFALLAFIIAYFLLRNTAYVKYGLAMGCCFFLEQAWQDYENHAQRKLVAYHINAHTAVNIMHHRNALLVIDSLLWNDKSKVRFHIQQHLWHSALRQYRLAYTGTTWKCIKVNNTRILVTADGFPASAGEALKADVLIVRNPVALEQVFEHIAPMQVIITSAVKAKAATAMKAWLQERNIPCAYLGDSEAFELSL